MTGPRGERRASQPAASIATTAASLSQPAPDDRLVIGLTVLYEDEPDARVIAHIPQVLGAISRGEDRRAARAKVRSALRDLIVSSVEPIDLLTGLIDAEPCGSLSTRERPPAPKTRAHIRRVQPAHAAGPLCHPSLL
jgi:hypothetical protein